LLEVSLKLSPAFLRKAKRLLNTSHLAANRVVLFLRRIQRIGCFALL